MTGPVKRRRYDSPVRRARAAATRSAILEAAERRFVRDGYAATSVAEVAREAGVSPRTVHLVFGTKAGLLRALWNARLRGDEEPAPVGERPWFRAVLDEPDPERAIRLNARNARAVRGRVGGLLEVIRDAAPADPEIADLWARIQREFHDNQRAVVAALHERGALRPGLGVARAADVLWTLNHPDVHRLLVAERGWTPAEHERWLVDALRCALLGRAPGGS